MKRNEFNKRRSCCYSVAYNTAKKKNKGSGATCLQTQQNNFIRTRGSVVPSEQCSLCEQRRKHLQAEHQNPLSAQPNLSGPGRCPVDSWKTITHNTREPIVGSRALTTFKCWRFCFTQIAGIWPGFGWWRNNHRFAAAVSIFYCVTSPSLKQPQTPAWWIRVSRGPANATINMRQYTENTLCWALLSINPIFSL